MSAGLIKHLRKKTDEDSNTKILMSQWEFDEKLVGKSLENVGSYYPHFSSHNESHSQQILVNIERLLGNNIEKLTATDTWLILEAAYWHDIGMLFNADEVQDVIEDEKFKDYVEDLANNNVQDLHEFAKVWHNDGWEAALVHYDNPYTGVEKYRQMVAEWYRRDHPANSERVVLKPFEKLNISSPRTELLPNRIYRYLAQICLSHGKSFNYVMKDLPFRQTGMGTEDCHPRFVACLLRLGDLFDIDDNRFCPVMARQVGNMPSFSETHKHKHQAIREFQLDNETVSITAICSTEMAYIECRNWFDWIREEIQNQMSQWKNIVPSRDFGLLPTINKLDVEMDDSKILLNNKPMKFSLDEKNIIELLQGNNLYRGMGDVIRELIQNAIDATFIKIWIDAKSNIKKLDILKNKSPYDVEVKDIINQYPINFSVNLIETTNFFENIWKISIEDCGTGISIEDLSYIQNMGGSDKNLRKLKIVREMPLWMQPTGTFGIGLHSAFLLNKNLPSKYRQLKFTTKNIFSHQALEVRLNSPLSEDNGFCFIEKLQSDSINKYGTITELFFKSDILFSSLIERNKSKNHDPILSSIALEIKNTFIRKIPPIYYNKDIINALRTDPTYNIVNYENITENIAWLSFKTYNCALRVYIPDTICAKEYEFNPYFGFRGQEIMGDRDTFHLFHIFTGMNIYIDIYGKSKDFVTIDRNNWQYTAIKSIIYDIKSIFIYDNLFKDEKYKIIHGFKYDKELGFETVRSLLTNKSISHENIEKLMFDDSNSVKDMLELKAFQVGKHLHKEWLDSLIKNELDIESIKKFPEINQLYYKDIVEFFLINDYDVYQVSENETDEIVTYHQTETLLFIKSNVLLEKGLKNIPNLGNFNFIRLSFKHKNNQFNNYYLDEPFEFVNTILDDSIVSL